MDVLIEYCSMKTTSLIKSPMIQTLQMIKSTIKMDLEKLDHQEGILNPFHRSRRNLEAVNIINHGIAKNSLLQAIVDVDINKVFTHLRYAVTIQKHYLNIVEINQHMWSCFVPELEVWINYY